MVCFWYDSKAASKMAWKREVVGGVWDMRNGKLVFPLVRTGMRIDGRRLCTASSASGPLRWRGRAPKMIDAQILPSASRIGYCQVKCNIRKGFTPQEVVTKETQ